VCGPSGRLGSFGAQDYDEGGDYVKAWLPELAKVPANKVHAPWNMTNAEMEASGVGIGQDYPHPPKSNYDRSDEGVPCLLGCPGDCVNLCGNSRRHWRQRGEGTEGCTSWTNKQLHHPGMPLPISLQCMWLECTHKDICFFEVKYLIHSLSLSLTCWHQKGGLCDPSRKGQAEQSSLPDLFVSRCICKDG